MARPGSSDMLSRTEQEVTQGTSNRSIGDPAYQYHTTTRAKNHATRRTYRYICTAGIQPNQRVRPINTTPLPVRRVRHAVNVRMIAPS